MIFQCSLLKTEHLPRPARDRHRQELKTTGISAGINVSVLVIDWKTYACVGDWAFTLNKEVCWPDPKEMGTETRLFAPFRCKNDHFTKTGSGQTHGKLKKGRVSAVSKLKALGVNEVMISLHPWAEPGSPSFAEMREQGLCLSYPNKTAVEWGGWVRNRKRLFWSHLVY
jgi:alpha-glucosidase (family GH31 glycosyl hydrolase)